MDLEVKKGMMFLNADDIILHRRPLKPYRRTPLMVTFYEGVLTHIDIQNFIEMGLQLVRFRMTHVTRDDKLRLVAMLRKAQEWVCQKYDVSIWPVAICLDLPNAAIRTGYMSEEGMNNNVNLTEGSTVYITSDVKYWNKCDSEMVFIDDPYTIQEIKRGTDITLCSGGTKLVCNEVVNKSTLRCTVTRSGILTQNEFVVVRGIKYKRPPLMKYDQDLLTFAKEFKFDVLNVHSVRYSSTLKKIKLFCGPEYVPVILSTICDQEGLDNIDDILKESDGIVLSRDLLTYQLLNRNSLAVIQMQLCAKCKKVGKPFFVSGGVLDAMLAQGKSSEAEVADVTNAVYNGAGLVLRHYTSAAYVLGAMKTLDAVCKTVESSVEKNDEFWRLLKEFQLPVNAAEACVMACVCMSRRAFSLVIINPTITGKTAILLSNLIPTAVVLAISCNPATARKLQVYAGIYTIVYDKPAKRGWVREMDARIQFAVNYAIKKEILVFGSPYVTICRSSPCSPFCDSVSFWTVTSHETGKYEITCDYSKHNEISDVSKVNQSAGDIMKKTKAFEPDIPDY